MNHDPFQVVRDFEAALCEYTGAPYAVTVTSCTMALLLAVAWHLRRQPAAGHVPAGTTRFPPWLDPNLDAAGRKPTIEIPKRTYVGVPMSIIHAGGRPRFRDEEWRGMYQLKPLPLWDSARWLTHRIWEHPQVDRRGQMMCISFHHTKHLGLAAHGGAILHDDDEADRWLRRARFDGRKEGIPPREDSFPMVGWHCYMTPPTAAEGLQRLAALPRHNEPLPSDDYPDLSQLEIFK